MPSWRPFFVFLLLVLNSAALTSYGQTLTPLHTFFQQNYDSSIIYQCSSNWNNSPNYLIIAKYQQQLEFFTYTSPYRNVLGHYYPGRLAQKFTRAEAFFRATTPDTNRYLLPKRIPPVALMNGWRQLQAHHFWLVQDDRQESLITSDCIIEDGDENTFYFLDKKAIQIAHFYAPASKEIGSEKDRNRQQALKVIVTLRELSQSAQ